MARYNSGYAADLAMSERKVVVAKTNVSHTEKTKRQRQLPAINFFRALIRLLLVSQCTSTVSFMHRSQSGGMRQAHALQLLTALA
jgi:hypothetical protein